MLLVHGLGNVDAIAVVLPNPASGSSGDATKAADFAKQIAGSGWTTITVLGCDTVSNKFAPNLASALPKGGTVRGYAGDALELKSHFEFSKTPGVLTLTSLRTSNASLKSYKTSGTP